MKPARQMQAAGSFLQAVEAAVINHAAVINGEFRAIVGARGELIVAGDRDKNQAGPGDAIISPDVREFLTHPAEIECVFAGRQDRRAAPRNVIVINRIQPII